MRCDSDGESWEFSDQLVSEQLPENDNTADFLIALVNVPIEDDWYSRRLGNNQVVLTFYEIKEILEHDNIPLENIVYRILYAYSLLYRRSGNKIPSLDGVTGFTHDETRGCLFDMNGIKPDLVASCHKPHICDECEERLKQEKVSQLDISNSQKEIKKIEKDLYFRIVGQIKRHPILTLVISSVFALSLGVIGSIVGSYVYSLLEKMP